MISNTFNFTSTTTQNALSVLSTKNFQTLGQRSSALVVAVESAESTRRTIFTLIHGSMGRNFGRHILSLSSIQFLQPLGTTKRSPP